MGKRIHRGQRKIVHLYASNRHGGAEETNLSGLGASLVVYMVGPASLMKMDHLRLPFPSLLSLSLPYN